MKRLLTFLCVFIPALAFCQSSDLVDSINDAIGPDYIFINDTVPSYHKYNLIAENGAKTGATKLIVVVASNADSTQELNKIFILARKDDDLVIVDSSAPFTVGDLGPFVQVKGNYLTVIHNFEKGFNRLTYFYNAGINRYLLSKLYYTNIEPNYNDDHHSVNLVEEYDVQDQSLSLKSTFLNYENGQIDKQKRKVVPAKTPAGLRQRLSKMKDPYDYDVFLTEGSIYKQMVKY